MDTSSGEFERGLMNMAESKNPIMDPLPLLCDEEIQQSKCNKDERFCTPEDALLARSQQKKPLLVAQQYPDDGNSDHLMPPKVSNNPTANSPTVIETFNPMGGLPAPMRDDVRALAEQGMISASGSCLIKTSVPKPSSISSMPQNLAPRKQGGIHKNPKPTLKIAFHVAAMQACAKVPQGSLKIALLVQQVSQLGYGKKVVGGALLDSTTPLLSTIATPAEGLMLVEIYLRPHCYSCNSVHTVLQIPYLKRCVVLRDSSQVVVQLRGPHVDDVLGLHCPFLEYHSRRVVATRSMLLEKRPTGEFTVNNLGFVTNFTESV